MQIKSIDQLLDTLNILKKQIDNLSGDSDVFLRVTKNLEDWDDKLKDNVEICVMNIKKIISELIVRYQNLYKEAQILMVEYRELYLKNNLGGF